MISVRMAEELMVTLRYEGPDVDNGSMPVEDVVMALQGFAGAYGRIAARYNPEVQHQLRVTAIRAGSFDALITIWAFLAENSAQLQALSVVTIGAAWIVRTLLNVVRAKLHAAGLPYTITIN